MGTINESDVGKEKFTYYYRLVAVELEHRRPQLFSELVACLGYERE